MSWFELAKQREWTVLGAFEDNDRSAYSGKRRSGWDSVRDRIAAGDVDHLVAWANDRLTRHPRELEDLIDLLGERHIPWEGQAAIGCWVGCHRAMSLSSWWSSTRVRIWRRRGAPAGVHRICCFLTMRFAIT